MVLRFYRGLGLDLSRDIAGSRAIAQSRTKQTRKKQAAKETAPEDGRDPTEGGRGKVGGGLEPLGKTLRPLVKPLLRKRPPLEASLLLDWQEAVGAELAGLCQPLRLRRERRAEVQVGSLEVACLSWAALELQHRAPQIIERVNAFLGVPAVQRLRIRQVAQLNQRPKPLPDSRAAPVERENRKTGQDKMSPPDLPNSGHEDLDRALARLAGTFRSRGDHEDAT